MPSPHNRFRSGKTVILQMMPSLLDIKCTQNNIEHRCTKPCTPKTNGMVERVNGTIKNNTILECGYDNKTGMERGLNEFLVFYNLHRRHGALRKELNVKTPCEAVEKWVDLKPEIFKINTKECKNRILLLNKIINNLVKHDNLELIFRLPFIYGLKNATSC